MGLYTGIVGLPNVGKSTLFNAITNSSALIANYRFATIEPNTGIVNLIDPRLDKLASVFGSKKTIYAAAKFIDIAGLIKGASKGEGLGNMFLSNIREADAICQVVRCFEDKSVPHEYATIDPIRDIEIINYELLMSDLDVLNKRIEKIKRKACSGDAESKVELDILEKIVEKFNIGLFCNKSDFDSSLYDKYIKSLNLITFKPFIYVANVNDNDISNPMLNPFFQNVVDYAKKYNADVIPISIKMEYELSLLDEQTKKMFMDDLNITETGLNKLVKKSFELLNLSTYFTAGPQEARSWLFKNGMTAPQCAGIIHSDFEKGFIKAEVLSFEDFLNNDFNYNLVKDKGKIRLEGKNYLMKDGDICLFKFNVTK